MKTFVKYMEAIKLKNGEIVNLGDCPSGILVFENEEPLWFESYDGVLSYWLDEVESVKETTDDTFYPIDEYFQTAEFGGMHETYKEHK